MNPLIHVPIDKWSTREKLSLASSVLSAGDQNWYSVSRSLKPFGELNRPQDWFSQKNCALQYAQLLENVETPKRKRGEKNEDTAQNLIVRKLTLERINELKEEIERDQKQLDNLRKNVSLLKNDNLSETDKKIIENQMIDALDQAKKDKEAYQLWLKEREEKYASISRKKSFGGLIKTPRKDDSNIISTTPSTPTKSVPSTPSASIVNQDDNLQSTNNDLNKSLATHQDDQIQLAIKQEKLIAREAPDEQNILKDNDKVQIIVLNDDNKKSSDKQKTTDLIKEDKSNNEKQLNKDKISDSTNKLADKVEITVVEPVQQSIVVKIEMENDQIIQKNLIDSDNKEKDKERLTESNKEDNIRDEQQTQTETIVGSKRKRTSTSISLSTTPTIVQTTQQTTPFNTQTPTTRRSGRIKPLRSSTISKTELSVSLAEQKKQITPTVSSAMSDDQTMTPLNGGQIILNDDSTKDSTTSGDVTDTYTSPNSPASSILNIDNNDPDQIKEQKELKEYKTWKKSVLLLLRQASTHKYSTLFTFPVTDDEAKGYSTVVFKPIDLTMIKKKIENGQIKTTAEFQRDIMLMFQNAIMYNSVKHEVHQMTIEMQKEILESIEDFIADQKSSQSSLITKEPQSSRRKSRTI